MATHRVGSGPGLAHAAAFPGAPRTGDHGPHPALRRDHHHGEGRAFHGRTPRSALDALVEKHVQHRIRRVHQPHAVQPGTDVAHCRRRVGRVHGCPVEEGCPVGVDAHADVVAHGRRHVLVPPGHPVPLRRPAPVEQRPVAARGLEPERLFHMPGLDADLQELRPAAAGANQQDVRQASLEPQGGVHRLGRRRAAGRRRGRPAGRPPPRRRRQGAQAPGAALLQLPHRRALRGVA
mmetsp:Transcript_39006/g.117815  ORF Transcript_39006/g.117815 Transcript_39006/m.117815 type:complete len:235 (-) Transcript_39006:92-796(-)